MWKRLKLSEELKRGWSKQYNEHQSPSTFQWLYRVIIAINRKAKQKTRRCQIQDDDLPLKVAPKLRCQQVKVREHIPKCTVSRCSTPKPTAWVEFDGDFHGSERYSGRVKRGAFWPQVEWQVLVLVLKENVTMNINLSIIYNTKYMMAATKVPYKTLLFIYWQDVEVPLKRHVNTRSMEWTSMASTGSMTVAGSKLLPQTKSKILTVWTGIPDGSNGVLSGFRWNDKYCVVNWDERYNEHKPFSNLQ